MPFYNSYSGFLYRQFLVYPPKAPSSTNLCGNVGLVTGANTGLGYQASVQLLSLGLSHLILAVRNLSKGEAARKRLLSNLPASAQNPVVEVWEIDLADYKSIVSFVNRLKLSKLTIDVVILNAGVANFNYTINPVTSHENSVQINWLNNALLTLLLLLELDRQAQTQTTVNRPRSVISIVGSETAAWAKFKEAKVSIKLGISLLQALDDRKNFDMDDRYYTSKLLQQLFFLELVNNHRSKNRSSSTVLNMVNPGFCYGSELHRTAEGAFAVILGSVKRVIGRSTSMGARTLVHGAVLAGPPSNGKYFSDCRPAPFAGYENQENGLNTQRKAWDEMVAELRQVVNMDSLLAAI